MERNRTKNMFLKKAIERMLAERDIKKSYHSQLRKACEVALDELEDSPDDAHEPGQDSTHVVPSQRDFVEADKYFLPFELACKSKSSKIAVISLDCIQKLIAYGHLTGKAKDSVNPGRLLIDRIVDAICGCFTGPNTEDSVQLQIVKALLTIVTSTTCEVHEGSLLLAVRTTFNIYLAAKSTINQTTAKASLRQMLNLVWNRMESVSATDLQQRQDVEMSLTLALRDVPDDVVDVVDHLLTQVDMEVHTEHDHGTTEIPNHVPSDSGPGPSLARPDRLSVNSEMAPSEDEARSPGSMKSGDESLELDGSSTSSPAPAHLKGTHVLQKDCFLLFRALCRLSMKPIPDGADSKSHEFKSKILSLELLLSVLQEPGPVFRSHYIFILAIKQYLCVALSKNGVSHLLEVFEISLAIFLALLKSFKEHLKMQIEVFFKEIFLNILETASSSFEHKWMVMQALSRICSDAQCVVDIYVNYDCDLQAANIFERLIGNIAKIALGRQAAELGAGPGQDRAIRLKGLSCLVDVLKCMVEWSRSLYVPPRTDISDSRENLSKPDLQLESLDTTGSPQQQDEWSTADDGEGVVLPVSSSADTFEALKQQKAVIEQGLDLFEKKPRQGIKFLQDRGLIGPTAWDVAEFFHREDRLDKTVMGDFMGDGDPFHREIMWAYVDQMDFTEMAFLSALRKFLDGFRLPGEAQKIDRLMEKFASRFFANNPNHNPPFASADTAYVLAYSIIMLTTDLHTPQVKNKMTKQQYIKMNRGINDSEDLPEWYLSSIYDEIAAEKIDMKPSSTKLAGSNHPNLVSNERQRRLLYNVEMQQMQETAKALMEAAFHVQGSPFTAAKERDHVRPMFKIAWRPCLATFSIGMQNCDDKEIIPPCLEGFRCAIRIAGIFHMDLERDAFVQALARFTLLTANSALSEMKTKNVDTIKTLILVAHTDGNYLGTAWADILRCISQLELAQLIGTSVKSRFLKSASGGTQGRSASLDQAMAMAATHTASDSGGGGIISGIQAALDPARLKANEILQETLGEASSQSVIVAVDRIFTGSQRLDGKAIVDFVQALVKVSQEELSSPVHPRMFSLQKMVEISYYNMDRVRFVFSRIWEVLGAHFNQAGRNYNEEVAFFAVDSLRQLSMKYFSLVELPNFRFQKDFLRPFEYIMKHTNSPSIRDLIVRCMTQMVNSQANQIKSGWKNIFAVFHMAASDADESIIELAFNTTSHIISTIFATNLPSAVDSFQEAIKTLAEFACNPTNPDMSMEAIDLIRKCANFVSHNPKLFSEHQWEDVNSKIPESERIWMRGWFPIMFEMSCIVVRCKLDVRTRALSEMFVIMKTYGDDFRPAWWKELFAVSCRIFDVMKLPEQQTEKAEWLMTTCNHALLSIVDVFSHYYTSLQDVVLQDLYDRISWCVRQENEQLARSGVECLGTLITSNGTKFTPQIWDTTVALLVEMFEKTVPDQLRQWVPNQDDTEGISNRSSKSDPSATDRLSSAGDIGTEEADTLSKHSLSDTSEYFVSQESAAQFTKLQIKCVVQLELIHMLDFALFGAGTSRREDEANLGEALAAADINFQEVVDPGLGASVESERLGDHVPRSFSGTPVDPATSEPALFSSSGGLYHYLTSSHLLSLVHCLMVSHDFAKEFNSDQNQRNVLWKAGFKGKEKPHLFAQERQSISCALRILFNMYTCDTLRKGSGAGSGQPAAQNNLTRQKSYSPQVLNRLVGIIQTALEYFVGLRSDQHREVWAPVILLIFTRLLSLPPRHFNNQIRTYHRVLSRMVALNMNPAIRALLARIVQRLPLRRDDLDQDTD